MKLAIFDLDNTLIAGDSDCLWGEFLSEHGYVDSEAYQAGHEKYYQDYLNGNLDIDAFLEFQLKALADNDRLQLEEWRENYIEEKIKPVMLPKAIELIDKHRQQTHDLLIITATNRFLTEPIANEFKIDKLIACEPELINGQYTGRVIGTPSYAEGKVTCFNDWLANHDQKLEECWFYSDSHNDIPLLRVIDHAIAVDPDEQLRETAIKNNWPIISLRCET
ncbi:MAG: HAD-IB family hydrolase [Proteobacteria bacterium]|nr:HAD-IB family hydrolase [Pseudomonadota bacterium]